MFSWKIIQPFVFLFFLVARDKCLKTWIFPENQGDCEITSEWGSGYPGDAVTKKFLRDNLDPVFGFPSIVRFSWKTAETLIEEKCVKMEFEEIEPEEDPSLTKNPSIKNFFAQTSTINKENKNPKSGRCKFVKDRNIENVSLTSFLTRPWRKPCIFSINYNCVINRSIISKHYIFFMCLCVKK